MRWAARGATTGRRSIPAGPSARSASAATMPRISPSRPSGRRGSTIRRHGRPPPSSGRRPRSRPRGAPAARRRGPPSGSGRRATRWRWSGPRGAFIIPPPPRRSSKPPTSKRMRRSPRPAVAEPMARSRRAAEPEIPRRDWWVAALSAIGLLVAGYLTVNKWGGGTALFCTAGSGCDIVQASRYAVVLGLPTAAWGAALYAAVGALALLGLPPRRWLAAFLLAVAGASFSLYLTYLSIFVIGAACTYCLASLAIALALFGTLLVRRPHPTGRRSPVRLARSPVRR